MSGEGEKGHILRERQSERLSERQLWQNRSTDEVRAIYHTDCSEYVANVVSWVIVDYVVRDFRESLYEGGRVELLSVVTKRWTVAPVRKYDAPSGDLVLGDDMKWNVKWGRPECQWLSTVYTHTNPDNKLIAHFNYELVNFVRLISQSEKRLSMFPELHAFCNRVFQTLIEDPECTTYLDALFAWRDEHYAPLLLADGTLDDQKCLAHLLTKGEDVGAQWVDNLQLARVFRTYSAADRSTVLKKFQRLCNLALCGQQSFLAPMMNALLPEPDGKEVIAQNPSAFFTQSAARMTDPDMLQSLRDLYQNMTPEKMNKLSKFITGLHPHTAPANVNAQLPAALQHLLANVNAQPPAAIQQLLP